MYRVIKPFIIDNGKLSLRRRRNSSEIGYKIGKQYVDYSSEVLGFEESPTTQILIDKGFIK